MEEFVTKVIDLIPGKIEPIEAIDSKSLDCHTFRHEFVLKHKPLLIKNAVMHWPAIEKWKKLSYLENTSDNIKVHVSRMFNSSPPQLCFEAMTIKKLEDALKEITTISDSSTYSIPACNVPSKWLNDLGNYFFLDQKTNQKPRMYRNQRLFIYKNTSTEWHYHPTDETLTTQLIGAKKCSLFRLTNTNWHFYSRLIENNFHHMECSKLFFSENAKPLIKYEGLLEAGDALYIPAFWWHGIDPSDPTIGITLAYCFGTPIKRLSSFYEPALRPLPIKQYPQVALSTLRRFLSREKWTFE